MTTTITAAAAPSDLKRKGSEWSVDSRGPWKLGATVFWLSLAAAVMLSPFGDILREANNLRSCRLTSAALDASPRCFASLNMTGRRDAPHLCGRG